MLKNKKVGVVGGGKMGTALISGLMAKKLLPSSAITISDIADERLNYLHDTYAVSVTTDNKKLVGENDILIMAVKPQVMAKTLSDIAQLVDENKLLISIAAGLKIDFFESRLQKDARVIRVMPNTPAMIGEGITAIARGKNATDSDMDIARCIFEAVGKVVIVNEDSMDAVTGLSGSGPAYVFMMIEALADGGVLMGLSREIATQLATQTLIGSAKLLLETGKHPGDLKDMVTSPGGTTIAGIHALEKGKLRATLISAVEMATLRSKELGK
ncbi:MAG: pyrroline-5-carboxylate reductase [Deltaproteobacteria bacterium]